MLHRPEFVHFRVLPECSFSFPVLFQILRILQKHPEVEEPSRFFFNLHFCRWAVLRTLVFRLSNPGFSTGQSQSASPVFAGLAQLVRTEANLINWTGTPAPSLLRRVGRCCRYRVKASVGNWSNTKSKSQDIGVKVASGLWSKQQESETL